MQRDLEGTFVDRLLHVIQHAVDLAFLFLESLLIFLLFFKVEPAEYASSYFPLLQKVKVLWLLVALLHRDCRNLKLSYGGGSS